MSAIKFAFLNLSKFKYFVIASVNTPAVFPPYYASLSQCDSEA